MPDDFVKVAHAQNQSEAELIQGLLRNEGVPSFVRPQPAPTSPTSSPPAPATCSCPQPWPRSRATCLPHRIATPTRATRDGTSDLPGASGGGLGAICRHAN